MIELEKKFLVIDDQPEITDIICEIIQNTYPEIVLKECNSSLEAIELSNSYSYDLIITDYHMPEKSGIDILRTVREGKGPNKKTPIIFITATKDEVDSELSGEFDDTFVFDKVDEIVHIVEMIEKTIS